MDEAGIDSRSYRKGLPEFTEKEKMEAKKESEKPKKSNFIFGDFFGSYMSKISLRAQYEGTMIGCALILLSLIGMIINWIFFANMFWGWKLFYIFNAVCGMMILWSSVITTFQQYQALMEIENVTKLLKESAGGEKW